MSVSKFSKGNLVKHRSGGGPSMVVVDVLDNKVYCSWMDESKKMQQEFFYYELEKLD